TRADECERPYDRVGQADPAQGEDRAPDEQHGAGDPAALARQRRAGLRHQRPGAEVRRDPGAPGEGEEREGEAHERGVDGERLRDAGAHTGDDALVLRALDAGERQREPEAADGAQPRVTVTWPRPVRRFSTTTLPDPVRSTTFECTCVPLSRWPRIVTSPACARPSALTDAFRGTITDSLPIPTSPFTNVWPFGSATFEKSSVRLPIPSVYFDRTSAATCGVSTRLPTPAKSGTRTANTV